MVGLGSSTYATGATTDSTGVFGRSSAVDLEATGDLGLAEQVALSEVHVHEASLPGMARSRIVAPPVTVKPLVGPVRSKPVICLPLPVLSTGVAVTVVVPGWEMIRCPTSASLGQPLKQDIG